MIDDASLRLMVRAIRTEVVVFVGSTDTSQEAAFILWGIESDRYSGPTTVAAWEAFCSAHNMDELEKVVADAERSA